MAPTGAISYIPEFFSTLPFWGTGAWGFRAPVLFVAKEGRQTERMEDIMEFILGAIFGIVFMGGVLLGMMIIDTIVQKHMRKIRRRAS